MKLPFIYQYIVNTVMLSGLGCSEAGTNPCHQVITWLTCETNKYAHMHVIKSFKSFKFSSLKEVTMLTTASPCQSAAY